MPSSRTHLWCQAKGPESLCIPCGNYCPASKENSISFHKGRKKDLLATEQAMGLQPGLCSNNALAGTIVLRAELLDLEPAWTWKQNAAWSREKEETAAVYLNTVPFVAVKAFHCSIVFSTVSSNFGTTRGFCFIYCF